MAFLVHAFEGISITNLAERHLRPGNWDLTIPVGSGYINHESSRKAFETGASVGASVGAIKDINHESSRKAFETRRRPQARLWARLWISITNLAERHLRQKVNVSVHAARSEYINHESSRKAFETVIGASTVTPSRTEYQSRI